ncbi:hypothetical protein LEP1GSC087_2984 [Leptospira interrogans serovar Bataviae str. L1111]|uniref:hypothetical protein n=1 Tax=Leptospira interrogans TaxID=173 RepID=UPI000297EACB|nr:hypothetical protein [Leptospira interrogans]EKR25596.1 hypothetical protein LEP1GSC087_2984 [Leptospira interrogans serovar Bataviae str. L1111]
MAQRYYIYYKQTGTGKLTVGKPTGYTGYMHNPDAKRMSFVLPENQGKAQEAIGKFVQDFQRLNSGKFVITNAVTQPTSGPAPTPKPPTGGTDPKPNTTVVTNSGKVEPEKKDDNSIIIIIAIMAGLLVLPKMLKGKRRR